jgi:hypothetical protein
VYSRMIGGLFGITDALFGAGAKTLKTALLKAMDANSLIILILVLTVIVALFGPWQRW